MGEAKFLVLMENHWREVNSRELSTDAGCSEHPVPAKEADGYNLCPAESLVGAPGLILNKWHV